MHWPVNHQLEGGEDCQGSRTTPRRCRNTHRQSGFVPQFSASRHAVSSTSLLAGATRDGLVFCGERKFVSTALMMILWANSDMSLPDPLGITSMIAVEVGLNH